MYFIFYFALETTPFIPKGYVATNDVAEAVRKAKKVSPSRTKLELDQSEEANMEARLLALENTITGAINNMKKK